VKKLLVIVPVVLALLVFAALWPRGGVHSLVGESPDATAAGPVTTAGPATAGLATTGDAAAADAAAGRPDDTLRVRPDTRPPLFAWLSVSPEVLHRTGPVRLTFAVADLTGPVRASYRVFDEWGTCVAQRGGITLAPGLRSLRVRATYAGGRPFLPGLYRVRLRLVDAAGNASITTAAIFRDYRTARARVWRNVPGSGRRVALTFDDGYDPGAWASILSTLRRRGVRATFFVNGRHVAGHPDLARRTVAGGNAIGSHTWTHTLTIRQTRAEIFAELRDDTALWWRVAGVTPAPYFRPPGGRRDGKTMAVAGSLGFSRLLLWDVDPGDWAHPAPRAIARSVLARVRPGSIVLLHLTPETARALPAILAGLRARGYAPVTVPALFRAAGYR